MKKRLLLILLTVLMIISLLPAAAFAQTNDCVRTQKTTMITNAETHKCVCGAFNFGKTIKQFVGCLFRGCCKGVCSAQSPASEVCNNGNTLYRVTGGPDPSGRYGVVKYVNAGGGLFVPIGISYLSGSELEVGEWYHVDEDNNVTECTDPEHHGWFVSLMVSDF